MSLPNPMIIGFKGGLNQKNVNAFGSALTHFKGYKEGIQINGVLQWVSK